MAEEKSTSLADDAVGYIRVSTGEQAKHEISLDDQRERITSYANARGSAIRRFYVDAATGTNDENRPEFLAMMDAACTNPPPFKNIYVHSLSRAFRSVLLGEVYSDRLRKYGVSIISITEEFGDGPMAIVGRQMINVFNEHHSRELSKHVTRTMEANARAGFWNGSTPPDGYKSVPVEQRGQKWKKKLQVDPERADVVRTIFHLALHGDSTGRYMGVKNIVKELKARGVKTARGNKFSKSTVHDILTDETYTGKYFYNRKSQSKFGNPGSRPREEWIEVQVPKIIDRETFHQVQLKLQENQPKMRGPRIVNSDVLLTGLAYCSCGSRLMIRTGTSRGGKIFRYYACSSLLTKGTCESTDATKVREDYLDQTVLDSVAGVVLTPERVQIIVSEIASRRQTGNAEAVHSLALYRKQRAKNATKHKNLLNLLAEGVTSDNSVYRETLREIEREAEHLDRLIEEKERTQEVVIEPISLERATTMVERLRANILNAPPQLKKRYLRSIVSTIVVTKDEVRIEGPKGALAEAINGSPPGKTGVQPPVRGFDRNWLPGPDSNQRPSG